MEKGKLSAAGSGRAELYGRQDPVFEAWIPGLIGRGCPIWHQTGDALYSDICQRAASVGPLGRHKRLVYLFPFFSSLRWEPDPQPFHHVHS